MTLVQIDWQNKMNLKEQLNGGLGEVERVGWQLVECSDATVPAAGLKQPMLIYLCKSSPMETGWFFCICFTGLTFLAVIFPPYLI